MGEFFTGMSAFEQVYWIIALIASAIFGVMLVMTFFGTDLDTGIDTDVSDFDVDDGGAGFQFFTIKNLLAFFAIFGWTGVTCLSNKLSTGLTIGISVTAGLLMMLLTSLLFFWMHKLAESGTLKMKNAIGKVGEVYLPVGGNRSKMGKIQIKVQGALRELEAITDEGEDLSTGDIVRVVGLVSAELLLVEKESDK